MTIPRVYIKALKPEFGMDYDAYLRRAGEELVRWGQAFNAWADSQEGVGTGQDMPVLIDGDDHGQTSGPPQPDSAEVTAKTIFDADNTQQQQGSGDLPPVMGDGLS